MSIELRWMVALIAIGAAACSQQGRVQGAGAAASAATAPDSATPAANGAAARTAASAVAPPPVTGAMKIYIDPATGQPRDPTPAEIAAAGRAPRVSTQSTTASSETATPRMLPSGQLEVQVGARAMHEVRVCKQPDGSLGEDNCPPAQEQKP